MRSTPGRPTALTVDLKPGEYEFYCPSTAIASRGWRERLVGRRLGSRRAAARTRPGIEIGRLADRARRTRSPTCPAIRVGHTTLIEGDDVRTGVTVVVPPPEPLFAGAHRINGNGELTGLEWVRDSGLLTTPIGLTNTHSVGVVRDALVAAAAARRARLEPAGRRRDLGRLPERHQRLPRQGRSTSGTALERAATARSRRAPSAAAPAWSATASRAASAPRRASLEDGWMVGVLVQANHGQRPRLRVNGVPVGERIGPDVVPLPGNARGRRLDHRPDRDGRAAPPAASASGSRAGPASGSRAPAAWASTRAATSRSASRPETAALETDEGEIRARMLNDSRINALYEAVIDAVEESILNAMLAAETMTGRDGNTVHALPAELLLDALAPRPARSPPRRRSTRSSSRPARAT